jgi:hypothetical protein
MPAAQDLHCGVQLAAVADEQQMSRWKASGHVDERSREHRRAVPGPEATNESNEKAVGVDAVPLPHLTPSSDRESQSVDPVRVQQDPLWLDAPLDQRTEVDL